MISRQQLIQLAEDAQQAIPEIKRVETVVTAEELAKLLNDHSEEQNILMLCLWPYKKMTGAEDRAMWSNTMGFFFLTKTDYSEFDREGLLQIFDSTELTAKRFVEKLLSDKADNASIFCNALSFLDENSISVDPVKALNGCNGHYVEFTLKTRA
ncbi:hypothetical protein [Flavobacterium psychrotrophum]|uniref:hypothetical protein n=1 Tax=Flavobacterium psychrotrophum TaxID=2294119 RepID=UPI000E311D93|nr:hypothetical protein [Flavobacterium psychrotrophum]